MSIQDCEICGVLPAMVTPATDDGGDVDIARAKALTRRLIDSGVHGLFVCGSTGEAPLLDREQRQRLIAAVAEENGGKLPLLVGVGAMATRQAKEFAKDAAALGAGYVVALPLHFIRVTEPELERYFADIADSASVPILLYNYPALTSGQSIPAALAGKLAREHNVVGIKDSSGDLTMTLRYIEEGGPGFAVFTGMDPHLLSVLSHGGAGTICAAANVIPDLLVRLYDYFTDGETEAALDLQRQALRASHAWSLGTFPSAVKAACALAGTPVGPPFPPALPLSDEQIEQLRQHLTEFSDLYESDDDAV